MIASQQEMSSCWCYELSKTVQDLVLGRKPFLAALMVHLPQPQFTIIPVSSTPHRTLIFEWAGLVIVIVVISSWAHLVTRLQSRNPEGLAGGKRVVREEGENLEWLKYLKWIDCLLIGHWTRGRWVAIDVIEVLSSNPSAIRLFLLESVGHHFDSLGQLKLLTNSIKDNKYYLQPVVI